MTDAQGRPERPGVPASEASDHGRRIYQIIAAYGWRIEWPHSKPVPAEAWPIDIINAEFAALCAAGEALETNHDRLLFRLRQIKSDLGYYSRNEPLGTTWPERMVALESQIDKAIALLQRKNINAEPPAGG